MDRKLLIEALGKVMAGVENKNSLLEGANSFLFDDKWIKSYNDLISVSYPFDSGLSCMIKAAEFYKALNKMKDDNIKMLILDDGKVQISGKSTMMKLACLDAAIIQNMVDNLALDQLKWAKLDLEFLSALSVAIEFAANNSAMTSMCGVSIGLDGMAATDGSRALFYNMEIRGARKEFFLPLSAAKEIVKLTDLTHLSVDESWIHFKASSGTLFSVHKPLVDFPREAIREFFPEGYFEGKKFSLPVGLEDSIDRASILSGSNDMGSAFLGISLDNKGHLIVSGNNQYGEIKEKIPKDDSWSFPEDMTLRIPPKNFNKILSISREFVVFDRYIKMKAGNSNVILALVK